MNSALDALAHLSRRSPQHIVVQGPADALSAAQLLARAERLSRQLHAAGANIVGLLCDNASAWAVADMASQFEGLCLVPVPGFFSDTQIRHVLDRACIDTLLVDAAGQSRMRSLTDAAAGEISDENVPAAPGLRLLRLPPDRRPPERRPPDRRPILPPGTAKLTFTSGSTGNPRGVCLSAAQCYRVASSLASAVAESGPRHLCVLPLSTLLENIGGLYMPMLSNGTSLLYPLQQLGMDGSSGVQPQRFLRAIEELRPNTMILVPQLLTLLDSALSRGWKAPDSLRFVAVGGGRVASAVVQRARAAGLPVYEGYGLSECASVVALNTREHDRPGTSGRLLPHLSVAEHNGELVVTGNSFLGYLNDKQSWHASSIATGDLGSVSDDGFVTVNGRSKNVLVSSFGRNISPEWVESELLATGTFAQVVVLGDAQPYCSALLVPASAASTNEGLQAAIDSANAALPDYARVQRWQRLDQPFSVADGTLTDNGRVRREQICRFYADVIEQLYTPQQEPIAV